MKAQEILNIRLNNQLLGDTKKDAASAALWMAAIQSQERENSRYALSLRSGSDHKKIAELCDAQKIIRTWTNRGTLHMVSPRLAPHLAMITGPEMLRRTASHYKLAGIAEADTKKIISTIQKILKAGALTRAEIFSHMKAAGFTTENNAGSYLLHIAAHSGLIINGPMDGKQETYMLAPELLRNDKISREEALEKVVKAYIQSHGPATAGDFAWWMPLSSADQKIANEILRQTFDVVKFEGVDYFIFGAQKNTEPSKKILLLPAYDEYFIGYKDRDHFLDPALRDYVTPGNGFSPVMIINGQVAGSWKKAQKAGKIHVEVNPFRKLSKAERLQLDEAVLDIEKYFGVPVSLQLNQQ